MLATKWPIYMQCYFFRISISIYKWQYVYLLVKKRIFISFLKLVPYLQILGCIFTRIRPAHAHSTGHNCNEAVNAKLSHVFDLFSASPQTSLYIWPRVGFTAPTLLEHVFSQKKSSERQIIFFINIFNY